MDKHQSNEDSNRQSARINKGRPPQRYGFEDFSTFNIGGSRLIHTPPRHENQPPLRACRSDVGTLSRTPINPANTHTPAGDLIDIGAAGDNNLPKPLRTTSILSKQQSEKAASVKSHVSAASKAESLRRKQELISKHLEEIQLQEDRLAEIELRKLEIERNKILAKRKIQEDLLQNNLDIENEIINISESKSMDNLSLINKEDRVRNWVEQQDKTLLHQDIPLQQVTSHVQPDPRDAFCGRVDANQDYQNLQQPVQSNFSDHRDTLLIEAIRSLRSKQCRDLPSFKGDIKEWPVFYSEFMRSTTECHVSQSENLRRLNKALEGNARRAVISLLNSPENIDKIISVLKMNFGRPEWVIGNLIDEMKSCPVVKEENVESFRDFFNTVAGTVTSIKNMKSEHHLKNSELLSLVVQKLPFLSRNTWGHYKAMLIRRSENVDLETFSLWLEDELDALYANYVPPSSKKSQTKVDTSKRALVMNHTHNSVKSKTCPACKTINHTYLFECDVFKKKNTDEKRQLIKDLRLCFNCMRPGHGSNKCPSKSRCKHCGAAHNSLLHKELINKQEQAPVMMNFKNNANVLLRCGKVKIKGPNGVIEAFALFDEGSTASQIESNLAQELGLSGPVVPITYRWTNDITSYDDQSQIVNAEIAGHSPTSKYYALQNVRTVENLSLPPISFNVQDILLLYPTLDADKLVQIHNAKPRLLIGSNNGGLIVPLKTISYALYGLQLCKCRLGWTIHGNIDPEEPNGEVPSFHISTIEQEPENEEISQLIRESYKIENFGIKVNEEKQSSDDLKALSIMKQTMKQVDRRFEIGHLYKYDDFEFPESKTMALRRLEYIEKKMDKDKVFAEQYCNKIKEYIEKDYARKLEKDEAIQTAHTWYLPHFGVTNPNKPGKFRLVMDAKAKSHGFSLNDFLLQGPDFVPPLIAVLWRARLRKISFSADIAEMFHQVRIRKEDQDSQRFLWRGMNRDEEPDTYVMTVMIFGAISSPSKAQYVKNENAKSLESKTPGILSAIVKQHYVDDYFDSTDTEDEAVQLIQNVVNAHEHGGFKLVKFISNSKEVINSLPDDLKAETGKSIYGEKVLGLYWNLEKDTFSFPTTFEKFDQELIRGNVIPTKRMFLRFMMSMYDPLGFLSPIIIKLKIIFQDLWRHNIQWDQEIPSGIFQRWKAWLEETTGLTKIDIPRCYFPFASAFKTAELHAFCDAGDKAFAAAVYLRIVQGENKYVSLVSAKSKVAPIKPMTIPRLELQGAVTASQLTKTIESELGIQITKKQYYTDSKVVISWLNTREKLNAFVGSRISKILETSNVTEWNWIPSSMNIADLATKELPIDHDILESWHKGPEFLYSMEKEASFKCVPDLNQTEFVNYHEEIENQIEYIQFSVSQQDIDLPNINRFSNFFRLIRSTAYYLNMRKILQLKKSEKPKQFKIDVHDINQAKICWYRQVQKEAFQAEFESLIRTGHVSKNSRLYTLSPFIHNGIIRMNGRIQDNNFEENNPIILPQKHPFTELLIKTYHEANLHFGLETVLNNLRMKYRILNCRAAIKRITRNCITCKQIRASPKPVRMGLLPEIRSKPVEFPFTYTGIDYFGPIKVKHGRRLEKHWVAIFTCLTSRALHLEIVSSLTSNSCIMAINRFMSIRGIPKKIYTDNGTNFIGADNELKSFIRTIDHEQFKDEFALRNIEWIYIPPGAPHMGGCWERMVRSVKIGLNVMVKEQHPSYETLSTALCEVMNIINNRPLTFVSDNSQESCAIVPNQCLMNRINNYQYHITFNEQDTYGKHAWKAAQVYADRFWKRWLREYRPQLIKRTKWHDDRNEANFQKGDIVLIVDETLPRGSWPKGVVEDVHKGRDGKIRSVKVRSNQKEYVRPVTKLVHLLTPKQQTF